MPTVLHGLLDAAPLPDEDLGDDVDHEVRTHGGAVSGGILGGLVVGMTGGMIATFAVWPVMGYFFGFDALLLMMAGGSLFGVVAGAVAWAG